MADGLPEGLITNSDAISGDIQSVDRITPEHLAQLWRGNEDCVPVLWWCPTLISLLSVYYEQEKPC